MRVSLKTDYALRAMVQLAAEAPGRPIKAEHIAGAQQIPLKFLPSIMNELKRAYLITSQRGPEGGYSLRRSADEITLADVIRAVDGPLANIHDTSLEELEYAGPAEPLRAIWMAVRTTLRSVLEKVTLADVASDSLPSRTRALADEYEQWAAQHLSRPPRASRYRAPGRQRRAR